MKHECGTESPRRVILRQSKPRTNAGQLRSKDTHRSKVPGKDVGESHGRALSHESGFGVKPAAIETGSHVCPAPSLTDVLEPQLS
jgi:hypothetical protein